MPTIYVLLCEKKRYYIGKTDRPLQNRIEEHFNNNGSEWTKKYKPIKVVEQITNADEFDEDKYTKKYMKKYGIDRVRGGTYIQLQLPEYSRMTLEKELCSASDLCFRCNRSGHFVSHCYASKKIDGSPINDEIDDESEEECWYCEYCDKEFSSEINCEKHEKNCKKIYNKTLKFAEEILEDEKLKKCTCFRCGRSGHYSNNCYASSHINGKKLYS